VLLMLGKLYDALISAGANEHKAHEAAEEAAEYNLRFIELRQEFIELKGQVRLVQWMLGFNLAISVALLWCMFTT
jgi:hypothetical protein